VRFLQLFLQLKNSLYTPCPPPKKKSWCLKFSMSQTKVVQAHSSHNSNHYFPCICPHVLSCPRSNSTRYKYPTQSIHWHASFTCLWRWNRQWVPKRRHLELRCRGITQKGTNYTCTFLTVTYARYVLTQTPICLRNLKINVQRSSFIFKDVWMGWAAKQRWIFHNP